ncbi:hypothetical protein N180_20920 [Pedobacter antarcticus 4BY]|uniref:Uncharacterized protein n=2 Tax=Pedobacter antarcticus TaxID=34086 RepID=A0A081PGM0_9SPHI|nr:hypothetical protein [Pedobacter antarcticus]KEQ29843.1 hypothetical protein N180_20920 [Pedobacter antarcticus 4BY]SFF44229.1 hypothetical protein SAMN03003324_03901 [Pedobacter antarcticus]
MEKILDGDQDQPYSTYIHKLLEFELITPTTLSTKMWPNLPEKTAYNKLYNKLNRKAKQRITDADIALAKSVCHELKLFL